MAKLFRRERDGFVMRGERDDSRAPGLSGWKSCVSSR